MDRESPVRETLDWTTFGQAARAVAQAVVDDGYRPDVVLSVARGGLLVGGALAYALGVKSCYLVNVEYYTGVDERLDAPIVLPPALDLDAARNARVLIADDVADTGHTLKLVQELCVARVAECRTAVLYEKPQSVVACEYVWRRTDAWVDFPWSAEPPVGQSAQPPVGQSAEPPVGQSAEPPVGQSAQPPVGQPAEPPVG